MRRYRLERWALQAAARELLPESRVAWCFRRLVPKHVTVDLLYSARVQRAHYKNLMICARLWQCPVCASKITERRRAELARATDANPDLYPVLVTFTLQHSRKVDLSTLLHALMEASRFLKAGKRWKKFVADNGLVGSVRSLEVTYGVNGWHPHLHVLQFYDRKPNEKRVTAFLKARWALALIRWKQTASYARGVDVRSASSDIARYVAKYGHEPVDLRRPFKWSMEHELTKAASKRARGEGGRTPTQLLADYMNGDRQAGELWVEYARVFKGRRQLVWSRGLRERLGITAKEPTDKELATAEDEAAYLLAAITKRQWRVILANDARGDLLEVASTGDVQQVRQFLKSLGAS
jgi:hypothetical protein